MSLRWQLTLALLATCTLVLGGLGVISYRRDAIALLAEQARAMEATRLRLERALVDPLWDYDLELVARLLEAELVSNQHLSSIALQLGAGRAIAFGREASGAVQPLPDAPQERDRSWELLRQGERLGVVELAISPQPVTTALAARAREIALAILILDAVLVALVSLLLQRLLLNRLAGIARRLERAPELAGTISRGDEVARLLDNAQALLDRLTAILDAIQDGVIVTDARLRIMRANPAAAELLGRNQDALQGAELAGALPLAVDGRPLAELLRSDALEAGRVLRLPGQLELRRSDGSLRHLALVASPSVAGGGLIIALHDLSHLVRIQEQLRQGQKLESIGQLAGGIAHDFNNMLSAITGAAELIKLNPQDERQREDCLELILRIAAQAAGLGSKLLAFSRKAPVQRSRVRVDELVDEACVLLRHSLERRIEVQLDPPAETLWVEGDSTALVNCLLNLGINARDAMPEGGVFRLAWRREALDAARAAELELPPGAYVRIDAIDHGSGIPQQLLGSIFDPFFTTKPLGRGTGLGLAATYGTIHSHGGHIAVASTEGEGSVFTIHLPLAEAALAADADGRRGVLGGRILVIDDDEGVREVTAALLRQHGFAVICAENGSSGLARFDEAPQSFTAVLLDLIMPDLSGKETFERLRAIRADVPVILVSGYNASIDIDQLLADGAVGLITKPFRSRELLAVLAPLVEQR